MGCTMRECSCGYADAGLRSGNCPKCGDYMIASFDEEGDHPPRGMSESEFEARREQDQDHEEEEEE